MENKIRREIDTINYKLEYAEHSFHEEIETMMRTLEIADAHEISLWIIHQADMLQKRANDVVKLKEQKDTYEWLLNHKEKKQS